MFSCFRAYLERFIKWHLQTSSHPLAFTHWNEIGCLVLADTVSGRIGLTVLLGEHLDTMLKETDTHLKTGSDAIQLKLYGQGRAKRKDTATILFCLVLQIRPR